MYLKEFFFFHRYSHDESHIEMDQTWLNVHYIFEGAFLRVNLTDYINNWLTKNYYPVLYVEQNSITNNLTISYLSSDYVDKDTEKLPVSVTYYENRFGKYVLSVFIFSYHNIMILINRIKRKRDRNKLDILANLTLDFLLI